MANFKTVLDLSYNIVDPSNNNARSTGRRSTNIGYSNRTWSNHFVGDVNLANWSIASRKTNVNTQSVSGDFISFKIQSLKPNSRHYDDLIIDIQNPTRNWQIDSNDLDRHAPASYRDFIQYNDSKMRPYLNQIGIAIRMDSFSNDIVIPNGKGQFMSGHLFPSSLDFLGFPSIDYAYTFVTVQNGIDSVMGGFGSDLILSENLSYSDVDSRYRNKFNPSENNISGSKLFVGGSDDDFLSGGNDADLLVGDRLNGYELYFNQESLGSEIPLALDENKNKLLNYQQSNVDNFANSSGVKRGLGNSKYLRGQEKIVRLLRPGNDVIHGHGGDDFIYGDSNVNDIVDLYELRSQMLETNPYLLNVSPPGKSDWSSLRIGADFLDGGKGNDVIDAGYGSDAIIGGKGSDVIYLGDQIIAQGYEPLWGPKIAWGSSYGDLNDKAPDLFILGDLIMSERQINLDAVKRDAILAQKSQVNSQWASAVTNIIGTAVSKLPVVGDIVDLASAIFGLLYIDESTPPEAAKDPGDIDGCTVIRDFGSRDLLVIKIRNNESLQASRLTKDTQVLLSDYAYNPLVGSGLSSRNSFQFSVQPAAGVSFNRLTLEGYSGNLYQLAKLDSSSPKDQLDRYGFSSAPTDGAYLLLGGDFYSNVGNLYAN
jgi:hypothetical protein